MMMGMNKEGCIITKILPLCQESTLFLCTTWVKTPLNIRMVIRLQCQCAKYLNNWQVTDHMKWKLRILYVKVTCCPLSVHFLLFTLIILFYVMDGDPLNQIQNQSIIGSAGRETYTCNPKFPVLYHLRITISALCSGPMVQHYYHGITFSTHPSLLETPGRNDTLAQDT